MYYLELIHKFWEFNRKMQLGSSTIVLYLYLLKLAYDKNSYTIIISDVIMSNRLGLTRKTVKSCKEKLRNLGLIQYETKSGCPCFYRIMVDYTDNIAESMVSGHIETINAMNMDIIEKDDVFLEAPDFSTVLKMDEKIVEINDEINVNESLTQNRIPTLKEFIDYAHTLEGYEETLDLMIKEKYFLWSANNWKNVSNRPISNWRLSLKNSLPYMKDKDHKIVVFLEPIPSIKPPRHSLD